MTQPQPAPFAAASARIVHRVADARRAEQREKGSPVHYDAIDYLDLEARRDRRLAPSSFEDELDHYHAAMEMVEAWQAKSVASGPPRYRGIFGVHGVATFRVLLANLQRNRDGRADLAYSQIAARIGQSSSTAFQRYHALIDAGVMDYQPRSMAAGVDGRGKHLRVQMSSVAWLTPHRLPEEWRTYFEARLEWHRQRRRDQARRREEAERRRLSQERMAGICAAKQEKAREGGTPRRQARAARTFDPFKVNPAAMRHLVEQDTQRETKVSEEEQRQEALIRANLADFMKTIPGAQGT
ncbi:hypothetical protein [uncultured Sphingomonas sp.]|uniref:hypothetical protein n=1 Tax=uncultured Sphingomonas sp. TaxID=158754 RepID=UPI00374A175A